MSYWEDRLGPENVFTPTDPSDLTEREMAHLEGRDPDAYPEPCDYCSARVGEPCRPDCAEHLFLTSDVGAGHGYID